MVARGTGLLLLVGIPVVGNIHWESAHGFPVILTTTWAAIILHMIQIQTIQASIEIQIIEALIQIQMAMRVPSLLKEFYNPQGFV